MGGVLTADKLQASYSRPTVLDEVMVSFSRINLGTRLGSSSTAAKAKAGSGRIPVHRVRRSELSKTRTSLAQTDLSLADSNQFIGGQHFMVLLDTGSSDLWVVSSDCTTLDCSGVPKYEQTPSLSLTDVPFHLTYLMGNVTGLVGSDTVTVGEFQVSSQIFAMANATGGLGLSGAGNSGILGLAFPAEASIADTVGRTLLENLFSALNDTSKRFFAFKLGRDEDDSSFTVGELDSIYANSTDDLTHTPVYAPHGSLYDYWKLPLQSLTINGTSFELSKSRVKGAAAPIAVLDTGTTLALGPTQDVARFWESVGGARQTDRGWEVPCNRAVVVGLVLGQGSSQKEYVLDPADVSWKEGSVDGGWCLGGVQGNDGVFAADWLLGDTFLRNVYVTHHAAIDSKPPAIGLRGLTDPAAALAAFVNDRGADTSPPANVSSHAPQSNTLSGGDICGIATAGGFVAGVMLAVLFYTFLKLCRRRRRHY
ncbi:acid protease [Lentinus tigrinus ALCF2SS1-7]|uniref:acid protease n=1 Tax=Lentinus tigrinus ALCF2SS1-7 TaxID=1328758 RepID=UPI001165F1DD|nr:acid protease [Lentinus tigrinus ALCF2SS1-7]